MDAGTLTEIIEYGYQTRVIYLSDLFGGEGVGQYLTNYRFGASKLDYRLNRFRQQ